jgi:predicted dehydrogenase
MEVECAQRNIHMLIEKPISCHPISDVAKVAELIASKKDLVVSVAYMFRYRFALGSSPLQIDTDTLFAVKRL